METLSVGKSRVVIGLDQALTNTGYCVLKQNPKTITIKAKGVIQTKAKKIVDKQNKKDYYLERLIHIESSISSLLNLYQPDYVFYEEIYLTGNRGGKTLAEVKIMVELLLKRQGVKYMGLPSQLNCKTSWRNILGLTSSEKEYWQKLCGESNEHIADAFGIAKAGLLYLA